MTEIYFIYNFDTDFFIKANSKEMAEFRINEHIKTHNLESPLNFLIIKGKEIKLKHTDCYKIIEDEIKND